MSSTPCRMPVPPPASMCAVCKTMIALALVIIAGVCALVRAPSPARAACPAVVACAAGHMGGGGPAWGTCSPSIPQVVYRRGGGGRGVWNR